MSPGSDKDAAACSPELIDPARQGQPEDYYDPMACCHSNKVSLLGRSPELAIHVFASTG